MTGQIVRNIGEVVNLLFGYDEELTRIDRSESHERHDPLVFIDHAGLSFSADDVTEDAGRLVFHRIKNRRGKAGLFCKVLIGHVPNAQFTSVALPVKIRQVAINIGMRSHALHATGFRPNH